MKIINQYYKILDSTHRSNCTDSLLLPFLNFDTTRITLASIASMSIWNATSASTRAKDFGGGNYSSTVNEPGAREFRSSPPPSED